MGELNSSSLTGFEVMNEKQGTEFRNPGRYRLLIIDIEIH